MKKLIYLFSLLFWSMSSLGQCPTNDIFLTSQEDIDNFATNYPNCSQLTHELNIDGQESNITTLSGLSQLTSANFLFIRSTQITTLEGLHNLTSITDFALWGNSNLQNMEGLSSLEMVGGFEIWINSGIQDLSGMDNLQSMNRLSLFANPNLSDMSALSFITQLNSLTIGGNGFANLSGLENLQSVDFDVSITNELIQNINELSNLQIIGGSLYIAYLPELLDVGALSQVSSVQDLYFLECNSLSNLSGMQNLQTVSGTLRIGFMPELIDISALSGITSTGALEVYENPMLTTLSGLEQLTSVAENVYVMDNPELSDISAINNIAPEDQSEVVIARNPNLSVCDNDFVCGVIFDPQIPEFITGNGVGCGSIPQVAARCLLSSESFLLAESVVITPNPVRSFLNVQLAEGIDLLNVEVYSLLGQKLLQSRSSSIDFNHFSKGVYLVKLLTNKGSITEKVVKN